MRAIVMKTGQSFGVTESFDVLKARIEKQDDKFLECTVHQKNSPGFKILVAKDFIAMVDVINAPTQVQGIGNIVSPVGGFKR